MIVTWQTHSACLAIHNSLHMQCICHFSLYCLRILVVVGFHCELEQPLSVDVEYAEDVIVTQFLSTQNQILSQLVKRVDAKINGKLTHELSRLHFRISQMVLCKGNGIGSYFTCTSKELRGCCVETTTLNYWRLFWSQFSRFSTENMRKSAFANWSGILLTINAALRIWQVSTMPLLRASKFCC